MIDTNQSLHCNYFCKHQMHQQKHGRDGSPSFSLLVSVESDFFASTCRDKNLVEYKTKSCGPTFWFIQQIGVQFWLWLFRKIFGILKSITEIKQKGFFVFKCFLLWDLFLKSFPNIWQCKLYLCDITCGKNIYAVDCQMCGKYFNINWDFRETIYIYFFHYLNFNHNFLSWKKHWAATSNS